MAERAPPLAKRIVIVGNGSLSRDFSSEVDSADFVLRFNEPKASIGMSGVRTDRLMMANSGGPMRRRLRDPNFTTSPTFRAAKEVIFAYHPQVIARYFGRPSIFARLKGRRADWTLPAIDKVGAAGKEIRIMPPQFYERGCRELGVPPERMRETFPSTGYFGIWQALEDHPAPEWSIEVCGFSWQGWQRHAWADERRWMSAKVERGLLTLIDEEATGPE